MVNDTHTRRRRLPILLLMKPWSRVENLEMHKVFPSAHNGCSAVEGVTDCFHITVRSDNNNTDRRKTNTFILTFNSNTAPAHINIGYLRVKVDWYIPNPLRCFKCQKFDHSSRLCRNYTCTHLTTRQHKKTI